MNILVGILILAASACSVAEATPPRPTGNVVAQARIETARFEVQGMACQACASRLQAGIRKLEGVINADVDFSTKILTVRFDASKIDAARIKSEIGRLGFEARPVSTATAEGSAP